MGLGAAQGLVILGLKKDTAIAMGENFKSNAADLRNSIASKNAEVTGKEARSAELGDGIVQDETAILNLDGEIDLTEQTKLSDIAATEDKRDSDISCTRCSTMNSRLTLNKFVDQSGMCGMGMGMGNTYSSEGAIELTVEELMALKGSLATFQEGEAMDDNFADVQQALQSKLAGNGSTVTSGCENGTKFIEITRADGSSTKIYDANGNGALDCKDYEFAKAIEQATQMIEEMNSKIQSITEAASNKISQIETTATNKVNELTAQKEARIAEKTEKEAEKADLDNNQIPEGYNEIAKLEAELEQMMNNIEENAEDIKLIQEEIGKMKAQLAEEQEEAKLEETKQADEAQEAKAAQEAEEAKSAETAEETKEPEIAEEAAEEEVVAENKDDEDFDFDENFFADMSDETNTKKYKNKSAMV